MSILDESARTMSRAHSGFRPCDFSLRNAPLRAHCGRKLPHEDMIVQIEFGALTADSHRSRQTWICTLRFGDDLRRADWKRRDRSWI